MKSFGTRCPVSAPACVIVNVRPAIVIVPVRGDVIRLPVTPQVTVVVPVPAPGDVTAMNPLLLTAVHAHDGALAVSVTDPVVAVAGTDADDADSENVHGCDPTVVLNMPRPCDTATSVEASRKNNSSTATFAGPSVGLSVGGPHVAPLSPLAKTPTSVAA